MTQVVYASWWIWSWTWLAPFVGAGLLALLWLAGVRRERVYGLISVLSVLASAIISSIALYYVL
ncbi:MAG: hypothetical protein RXO24_12620, partial [Acidilobus sp.]